ncbi:bcl-2/adenovirus E1B 19 kDa-interacting protein 2-like protein isoform 2-T4 [Menidia menidia]
MQDMELSEEWQDDGFPRPLPEDSGGPEGAESPEDSRGAAPPTSLALSGGGAKKRLVAPALSLSLSQRDPPSDGASLDINLEALDTPSGSESGALPEGLQELEWDDDLPGMGGGGASGGVGSPAEPWEGQLELDQVDSRGRRWRRFCVSGQEYHVNMSVLEPYLQVLSHGGYYGDGMNAIILFTSCYLPENSVENYDYVMENLFRYIVGTLDLMVSEDYLLVYLCALAPRNKLPNVRWLHQCYTSIHHSEKFSRKIRFIQNLQQLSEVVPTDRLQIPDAVRQFDESLTR